MESTGKPEQVHISEETAKSKYVEESYYLEKGEDVDGHQTYFVSGRKRDSSRQNSLCPGNNEIPVEVDANYLNGVKLSKSASNLTVNHPRVPPASPVGINSSSLNPSPVLSSRPRVSSLNRDIENNTKINVRSPPKIIVTAKSLPKNLDSDDPEVSCIQETPHDEGSRCRSNENKRSFKQKLLSWNISKLLKKPEEDKRSDMDPLSLTPNTIVISSADQNGYQQLPVVIEAHTLNIPRNPSNPSTSDADGFSPGHTPNLDDMVDIRSYISHSRSDISHFGRTGSYRSQEGKSHNDYSQSRFYFLQYFLIFTIFTKDLLKLKSNCF